jgi:tetratricopeptide (TPR) repeat protein
LERRGFAYRSLKQYEKAIEDFTKLIKVSPKDIEAYRRRGYAYSLSGENEKALEDYRKILELKPGDEDATNRIKSVEARKPAAAGGGTPGPGRTIPAHSAPAPSPH